MTWLIRWDNQIAEFRIDIPRNFPASYHMVRMYIEKMKYPFKTAWVADAIKGSDYFTNFARE